MHRNETENYYNYLVAVSKHDSKPESIASLFYGIGEKPSTFWETAQIVIQAFRKCRHCKYFIAMY